MVVFHSYVSLPEGNSRHFKDALREALQHCVQQHCSRRAERELRSLLVDLGTNSAVGWRFLGGFHKWWYPKIDENRWLISWKNYL